MDPISLLETKLYFPSKRSNFIHRRRLIDKLSAGLRRKLTLVCAPAGYGKTTLLSDWIRNSERPAAWLSLDEEDNEINSFLAYFIAALQKIDEKTGVDIQAALNSPERPPVKSLLAKLISEIGAAEQDFVVVLDDYHQITAKAVHEALDFFLDHLPANLHLVIAGRAEPPLPLARFRVREQMTEIRTSDLEFTEEEAKTFLNTAMGLDLSSEEIAALESRTEGWIASLQLAALSLQGREDTKAFVNAFSGSHRYVLDYLIDEVLSCQTQEVQAFLVRTSMLDRLCGPLCDHVLESITGQQTLDQLDNDNLFLVPLDDERRWFRYHHLFADLLSQRLHQEDPELIKQLHQRAAAWLKANGFISEAINHALTAKDFDRAAQIIESVSSELIDQGRLASVLSWTEKLPPSIVADRPQIALARAWACLISGKIEAVEPLLAMVDARLLEPDGAKFSDRAEIVGSVKTIRVFIAAGSGDLRRDIEIALEAYNDLPTESSSNRNALATNLGYLYLACGELDSAVPFLEGVRDRIMKSGGSGVTVSSYLGDVRAVRGRLRQAEKIYRSALEAGAKWAGDQLLPIMAHADVGLAKILYEWDDRKGALFHLTRGIEAGEQARQEGIVLKGNLVLVRMKQTLGDIDGARIALRRAQEAAGRAYRAPEAVQIASWVTGLWLAEGNLDAAGAWAGERFASIGDDLDYVKRIEHIMVARVLVAENRADEALELLSQLLRAAKTSGHGWDVIEILTLSAVAAQANNNEGQGISTVKEALDLAEPEGYIHTFIDHGEPMVHLLRGVAAGESHAPYAKKLLRAFELAEREERPSDDGSSVANQALVDPLSERELEVLRLIVDRLKYIEIAGQLVVSINTVRTHAKNVYRKLGVNSRTDAINKAKELNLI